MIIRERSFPHPVLSPFGDDVIPNTFGLRVTVQSDADAFYLAAGFDYTNGTLSELIRAGRATHSLHVECKRNFYRELFSSQVASATITIPARELAGRVEVSGFIRALESIPEYRIDGSHPDYGDTPFPIVAGDILAAAPTVTFDAYVDYDPLRRISSILTIRRSEDVTEGPMTLETDGDRLVAVLSQRDYDRYIHLKGDPQLGSLLANQVVVPAILEAVQDIRSTSEDEFELEMSKRWFRSIVKKLQDEGLDIRAGDTAVGVLVQQVLRFPLRRSLEGLISLIGSEELS